MNFKKFQFAGTPNSSVLAEKGEVYKSPNGQIQQIAQHAPSHDDGEQVNQFGIKSTSKGNGGVVVDADSVLSDSLTQVQSGSRKNSMKEQIVKIKPEEGEIIASQLGLDIRLKKSVSPSKLFLEIQEAKDKIALKIMKASEKTQKTRESSNALQANQAQLMSLPTDEEIYEAIFHTQEEKKENSSLDFDDESTSQYGGAKMYPSSTQVSRTIVPFFAISLLGEKEAKPFDSLTPENYLKLAVDNGKIVGHDLQDIQFETTKPLHKFNRGLDEKYRNDKEFWKISDLKYNQRHNQKIPKSMLDDILDGAIKSGVDPYDALAVAQRESGFGNNYSFDKAPKSIFSNWYEDVQLSKGLNELSYKTIEQAKKYSDKNTQYPFASEMNTIKEKTKKYGLRGYNYGDPDYPNKIAKEKEIMFSDENKEFRDYVNSRIKRKQYGGAHYNKNLNYILPNSLLDEKNEDVEEPVFKLKKKEIKGDKRNGYSAYEQNGEIYMDNINDEPIKQHETFHYLRSKGYFSPREQAIENELLDGSIYSPLDKNKLNSDIYSPEELAARFHSISGYLPNNYKEEDFKKLWETGKDLQIQDLKQVIPYDKALYYMNNYHPSKMQMGGMVSKDSSNLKEIKKQRDWLRAWYGERDIVTEPIEIFENELKSVNGSKTKDPEILKQNEEFRERGKKTNFDVSAYYHTPSDRSVFLKDVTGTTDPIHEFTHSIDNNYGDNIGTFNSINPFHPLKTDYTKLGVKPIKENDYFTNTEETYARLNEARYSSGYAANYKPTLEDIKEQRRLNKKNKPKAYNHLFDYYDDNSIMQMWNGLSDTRFEESSVENPMLQQTAKYGIKKQFGGGSSILKQLQLL